MPKLGENLQKMSKIIANWVKNTTFPMRGRSERVGLSSCVKHGHVVPSQ